MASEPQTERINPSPFTRDYRVCGSKGGLGYFLGEPFFIKRFVRLKEKIYIN